MLRIQALDWVFGSNPGQYNSTLSNSRQYFDMTDEDEDQVTTIRTASSTNSPFKSGARMMTVRNFGTNLNTTSSSSSDEDEEVDNAKSSRRLKNPMFPQLF